MKILASERIEAGCRRTMIARLETVTADSSSLHRSRSRNLSPFLTLEPSLVHRDNHSLVDRVGLLMIHVQVRHCWPLTNSVCGGYWATLMFLHEF
jgi:hypothetical protein